MLMFEAGKTYRYKKTDYTYLCLFVGQESAFLRRLSDGLEFLERGFSGFSEVKPKGVIEGWLNVYKSKSFGPYPTKEEASKAAAKDRIACIYIRQEYEEGEGL